MYNLSFTYAFREEPIVGTALIAEALELYEGAGDRLGVAHARWALANVQYVQGPEGAGSARELALLALPTFEEFGARFMVGWTMYTIGLADLRLEDTDEALPRFIEALRMFQETVDVSGYTMVLDVLAAMLLQRGDRAAAARIAGAVDTLERTTGTGLNKANRVAFDYVPEPLRTDPDTAAAFAEGAAMDTQAAIDFALKASTEAP